MSRNETEWENTPGLAERPDAEGPAGDGEEANSIQASDPSRGRWGTCWGTCHKELSEDSPRMNFGVTEGVGLRKNTIKTILPLP